MEASANNKRNIFHTASQLYSLTNEKQRKYLLHFFLLYVINYILIHICIMYRNYTEWINLTKLTKNHLIFLVLHLHINVADIVWYILHKTSINFRKSMTHGDTNRKFISNNAALYMWSFNLISKLLKNKPNKRKSILSTHQDTYIQSAKRCKKNKIKTKE